ncbi:MAG: hypothetical protein LBU06_05240 [Desulfovibrio sp.]|jgi:hypothetical protein|nr:hypothetical protein [Desulfovibrio sp.]
MKKYLVFFIAVMNLWMTGCASNLMQPVDPAVINTAISQKESGIVFFRPSALGGVFHSPVLEVKQDGSLNFIANVAAKAKFLHKTNPGKHLYLIDGEFGYFMEAELDAGKIYYAYVIPKIGWWRPRFDFTPVTNMDLISETFQSDFAQCKWYENTMEGNNWFLSNKPSLEKRYSNLIYRYQNIKLENKVKMLPEYGSRVFIQ